MSKLGEKILSSFSRDPAAPDYVGGTLRATLQNALDFLNLTVPDFAMRIRGKTVLDFGCGHGLQALAIARAGAQSVVGVDIRLSHAIESLKRYPTPNVQFMETPPPGSVFDVVISCSSFEHFQDPRQVLDLMNQHTRPGGSLIISFAEPWLSPYGGHMFEFSKLPWVTVLFSEQTVLNVRAKYRADGATRYEEIEGGLNRMTLARFEKLMRGSNLSVELLKFYPTKNLPLVAHLPVIREFLVSSAACVLRKPA